MLETIDLLSTLWRVTDTWSGGDVEKGQAAADAGRAVQSMFTQLRWTWLAWLS
jgi:hypothetical protein